MRVSVLAFAVLLTTPALARDVPFVPTPEPVVETMLDMAEVGPDDVVLDLGSGDGRIVVAAAQRGARAMGVDIDPRRIAEARENAAQAGLDERAQFIQGDLFEAELSPASVVTMYLLPEVNRRLRPRLLDELEPGTRVVSHDFDMGEWLPDQTEEVPGDGSTVHMWIIPARVEGAWLLDAGDGGEAWRVELDQHFQYVTGTAQRGDETVELDEGRLRGEEVVLQWPDGRQFSGRVEQGGRMMAGSIEAGDELAAAPDNEWQAVRDGS